WAWCWGGPGRAAARRVAARHAGVVAWQAEALAIAERTAVRPFEDCRVVDACLCHGSAGLAHLFNRMYQSTGSPVLREAALSWFGRVLDDYQPGSGIGGFRSEEHTSELQSPDHL